MKLKEQIYLDYAAATPLDPDVAAAMQPYAAELFQNPSALYGSARKTRQALEDARAKSADLLGAKKSEIIFTAGGTESVNLALLGVARHFPGAKIIAGTTEHQSVLSCLDALEEEGHKTALAPVGPDGLIVTDKLIGLIDDETVLVSLAYANSEIGVIQPLGRIAKELAGIRADRQRRGVSMPLYFHTDAAQAAGALDLHVSRLGIDLLSLNGSKIYGPKQSGLLYVRSGVALVPLVYGGGQEKGLRAGTESVANAVGLAVALSKAQKDREAEGRRQTELRDRLIATLGTIDGSQLNGHAQKRLPGNVNFSFTGVSGETLVLYLDNAGIMAATGSACSAAKPEPSHVLLALGLDRDTANSSLRLTLGRHTAAADVERAGKTVAELVLKLRQAGE